MRRLLAVILAVTIWFSIAPIASAETVSGLVPCSESAAFQKRATVARPTTDNPDSGKLRFERYSQALCGPEGLPRLIVDGRLSHAGDFTIPSLLFLYITGWIGWVGRMYLISARKSSNPEEQEIILNVPKAIGFMLAGFSWPLLALKEFATGELLAKDDEITVSPR
ncbi:Photosystem I reaction center subunit III [Merismopedia glauca]|uniref:Photosystem I reaction center subunit III n=1 Tax=Merismopedia glauca CCAP 1448/3 TaxID=1296344 RepID=A0A2T1C2H7_9CYAN|nr:Photosystem I reaction center subunit III [Merismopedia glauca]PSB02469.1 Photosystem I reaction center subunit III [Merismopedia glauca CCAP 1448/3]